VEPKTSVQGSVGGGVAFGVGVAPTSPTFGLTLNGGFRWPSWSLALEARWYPWAGGKADEGNHSVIAYRLAGASVACGHWHMGFGCGFVEFGAQHAENDAPERSPQTKLYGAGGLRLGIETPLLPGRLTARITGDVLLMPHRLAFKSDVHLQWMTPRVSGALGIGIFLAL
jgi:hypothetical protein